MLRFRNAVLMIVSFLLVLTVFTGCGAPNRGGFIRAAAEPDVLLAVDVPSDGSAVLLASMQGLLAGRDGGNLVFRCSGLDLWLAQTGVTLTDAQPDGTPWNLDALLRVFSDAFSGYILCGDDASAAVAVSLAHQLNAVVVPEPFEAQVKAAGLTMLLDVRGKDDAWLRASDLFQNLSRAVAVEQPVSFAPRLVDYAVAANAYFGFFDGSRRDHTKKYAYLDDNAVVFGWNTGLGEYETVRSLSSLNACLVPADHAFNLSVISGFSVPVRRKGASAAPQPARCRTVCLVMSDGDNLQWFLNDYGDAWHYGSPARGTFPFAWGVPACAAELASPILAAYYHEMTENDGFVLSLSGLGYTFPSKWKSKKALRAMAEALSGQMEKTDTHTLLVLDDGGFSSSALDILAAAPSVNGVFYIDYADYAGLKGKARSSSGTPIVSARFKLWYGAENGSPEEIAAAVNALPDDPASPDSYSFIIVHAWSGLDENGVFSAGGDTMRAVERLVSLFGENVRLVSPETFFSEYPV